MKVKHSGLDITNKKKGFVPYKSKLVKSTNFKSSANKLSDRNKIESAVKNIDPSTFNLISVNKNLGLEKNISKLVSSKSSPLVKNINEVKGLFNISKVKKDNKQGSFNASKDRKENKQQMPNLKKYPKKKKESTSNSIVGLLNPDAKLERYSKKESLDTNKAKRESKKRFPKLKKSPNKENEAKSARNVGFQDKVTKVNKYSKNKSPDTSKCKRESKKRFPKLKKSPKQKNEAKPASNVGLQNQNNTYITNTTTSTHKVDANLDTEKVTNVVSGLLKMIEEKAEKKTDLLDLPQPVFLQVECIKIPICPTKQLRFELPHPLVDHQTDVVLIVADKKGSKIYPEKSEEHYTELLKKHNVDFIQKVLPLRALRQEYSQYEMRRKLVDRYDILLVDASVSKSLARLLGKFILYKRKMPIAVHLDRPNLHAHLKRAMSKTQMTVKSNGHCSTVVVGTSHMAAADVAANIVAVCSGLSRLYPGGWPNVRCLTIRTPHSQALPVYLSLVSSNSVKIPVEHPKKRASVEGELSTMLDTRVKVRPDGTIVLKKEPQKQPQEQDDMDDEIIEEADKYRQSAKTVRYDDTDDDDDNDVSDKEADAITEAVEDELLNEYSLKMSKEDRDADEDEEYDESSDEEKEDTIIPTHGKKRKMDNKKQLPKSTPNKKQKKDQQTKKQQKNKGNNQSAEGGVKKRGNRGGKKNKMSKDQRKALIKRRKAGKK